MARDRLAAMRNGNSGGGGGGAGDYTYRDDHDMYGEPQAVPAYRAPAATRRPPPSGLPSGPGQPSRVSPPMSYDDEKPGYDDYDQPPAPRRYPGGYDEQPPMEMGPVGRQTVDGKGPREVSGTEEFFEAIANLQVDLKELQHMIGEMGDLARRSLDAGDGEREALQQETAQMGDDIRLVSAQLKRAIQGFEADHSLLRQRGDPEGNVSARMAQLAALKKRFVETVQRYAEVEQGARRAVKARIERQVRIVKPDASEAEIRAAVEDEANGAGAVFQQALVSSNRMGSARNALKEVQSRAADIKRIEETITELAQMFNDMATMVEEQDVQIQHIEKQAEAVNQDVEAATTELKAAVVSAKGARSKRKCCFVIILILIIVIGGGGAVYALYKTGVIGGASNPNSQHAATNSTTTASPAASATPSLTKTSTSS